MWQGYTTNEDTLLEFKINPVAKKKFRITEIAGYNTFNEWTNYCT